MVVVGELSLLISDPALGKVCIKSNCSNQKYMWKTHPQINKERHAKDGVMVLKDPTKPFPVGNSLAVLKWKLQGKESLPLILNCWPTPLEHGFTMNVECNIGSLSDISDIAVTIPCPGGIEVGSADGEHREEQGRLVWTLPLLDDDLPSGSVEFTCADATAVTQFFPMKVSFVTEKTHSGLEIESVTTLTGEEVKFSKEVVVVIEAFDVFQTQTTKT
eukprot:TRINITY_DN465_c0_g1_i15.p1 TRINITY_DN465_c0_g1~~TRINITY_DN465_c0_g1_i15.p1  ORF type:complete len:217 (-),score=63.83 TRINITY_DN465_c0_g1_i15:154-804(-)